MALGLCLIFAGYSLLLLLQQQLAVGPCSVWKPCELHTAKRPRRRSGASRPSRPWRFRPDCRVRPLGDGFDLNAEILKRPDPYNEYLAVVVMLLAFL